MKNYCFLLFSFFISIRSYPQASLFIDNVNLIDVNSGKIIPNTSVLINNGVIEQLGSSKKIKNLKNYKVVNGSGKYLIPGMIDAHIHFFQSGGLYTRPDGLDLRKKKSYEEEKEFVKSMITDNFLRYLQLGITTVMDVGGPFYNFKIRDSIARNNLSPNVFVTGPLFSTIQPEQFGTDDPPIILTTSIEKVDSLFNIMIKYKPDYIKAWYVVTKKLPADSSFPIIKHLGDLAHQHHIPFAVHATELNTAKLALKAGADILVHSIDDEIIPDEFLKELKSKNITYIPTLAVRGNYFKTFFMDYNFNTQDLRWANPLALGTLFDLSSYSPEELPSTVKYVQKNPDFFVKRKTVGDSIMAINLKTVEKAGILIATGTDAGNIGTMHASSYMEELYAMKKAGLNNAEVIKAATINAAKGFKLDKEIGSIEQGKKADAVLLSKNPFENLENLKSIEFVIRNGALLSSDSILHESSEMLVQRQLNAYNARNIDAFMDTYSDDIKLFYYPQTLQSEGKESMRKQYENLFNTTKDLYCEIKNRIVIGNKVIDEEYVRFNGKYVNAVAIYEIANGKISKVTFLKK